MSKQALAMLDRMASAQKANELERLAEDGFIYRNGRLDFTARTALTKASGGDDGN